MHVAKCGTTKQPERFRITVLFLCNQERFSRRMLTHLFVYWYHSGQRSLAGYDPWGCKELDTTKPLILSLLLHSDYENRDIELEQG